MSIYDTRVDRADQPLTETEIKTLHRLLSDPFSLPPEFWTALKTKFEQDPPALTWDSIIGFDIAANRAIPVVPVINLAVDVSAADTDLPSPGLSWNNIWQINPGGGSLRSIESGPTLEGTRITLKHDWIGSTTLKHNDIGGSGRPLFLNDGDVTLTDSESIDLVLLDTFWKDTGRVETPAAPASGPLIQHGSATSATLSNNTLYTIPVTFPTPFTTVFRVFIQLASHSSGFGTSDIVGTAVDSLTTTGFNLMLANGPRNGGTYTFNYMALGT